MIEQNSLVLYKKRPARVVQKATISSESSAKSLLVIELQSGEQVRVRTKDVSLLHPGPLTSLKELVHPPGDVETAWEILLADKGPYTLAELAELAFGEYTPSSAWAAWLLLEDGLYFSGSPELKAVIQPKLPQAVAAERRARQERENQALAWADFLRRAQTAEIDPEQDRRYISEIEGFALGQKTESKVLRELGHNETPTSAHAWLIQHGLWDPFVDPYPSRLGLSTDAVELPLPELPDEARRDLTHLPAFAIDEQGNQDPDDALSLAEGCLWVHVADPAALVIPDSPLDMEARRRGSNLYLPEGTVGMLPAQAVQRLGLGLQDRSPALSFCIELGPGAEAQRLEIIPSWVHVQRLTYETVEHRLDEEPFQSLHQVAQALKARRQANGAVEIELPETMVKVIQGKVVIRPVLNLSSRELVKEAMLLAGQACAQFAQEHQLPFPYTTQDAADPQETLSLLDRIGGAHRLGSPDMALAFAQRRTQKRSQVSSLPGPHAGLGLSEYARVTSPLRRYSDLIAHQQLHAFLAGQPLITEQELLERIAQAEAAAALAAQAESLARQHWTLVYLQEQTDWQGEGILVEKRQNRGRLIIPSLALESQVQLRGDQPLNTSLQIKQSGINLPELQAFFQVL